MATQLDTTEERPAANLPAPITAEGERFQLRQRQARMFAMSPLVPEHLRKGTPETAIANCWIALTMAEAMGEQPLILMQNIHVVSGKAGFAAQYMIARANASGVFKGRIDWSVDRSDANNLSVTAYAYLADTGEKVEFTVDMKMAKAEGWTKNPKYQSIPELMLRYRSATFLVRLYAPDVMLGYQTVEEVEDVSAAALPSAEPLTSKMLIEQSREAPPTDERPATEQEQRDHNGGYTIAEEEAQAEDEAEAATADTAAEFEPVEDEVHPAAAKADEIIAELNDPANNAIMDIGRVLNRHELDLGAMPDEQAVRVEVAADKRRQEIRAAQQAASAQQEIPA